LVSETIKICPPLRLGSSVLLIAGHGGLTIRASRNGTYQPDVKNRELIKIN
jgi:hypothetical protein